MKKFKISLLAVLAIFIGIAASSFTTHPVKKTTDLQWYVFTGTGSPADAGNYEPAPSVPSCNTSPDVVCAIQATDDNGLPNQTELDAINSASSDFTQMAPRLKYKN
jgi:hypothetical protein